MWDPNNFDGLEKLSDAPVIKTLTHARAKLQTALDGPAGMSPSSALAELADKDAVLDMLMVLAHTLPPREATWWACLSGWDLLDPGGKDVPWPLKAAEDWVFRPGDDTRQRARDALEAAAPDDDTELCAMAATCAAGTLGPGELEDYEAPAGIVGNAAYGMALLSLYRDDDAVAQQGEILVNRALDIARGGNGKTEISRQTEPNTE